MTDRERYLAGWKASANPNGDLDSAEARHERRHGRDRGGWFSAGWVDYAIGRPKGTALTK